MLEDRRGSGQDSTGEAYSINELPSVQYELLVAVAGAVNAGLHGGRVLRDEVALAPAKVAEPTEVHVSATMRRHDVWHV